MASSAPSVQPASGVCRMKRATASRMTAQSCSLGTFPLNSMPTSPSVAAVSMFSPRSSALLYSGTSSVKVRTEGWTVRCPASMTGPIIHREKCRTTLLLQQKQKQFYLNSRIRLRLAEADSAMGWRGTGLATACHLPKIALFLLLSAGQAPKSAPQSFPSKWG